MFRLYLHIRIDVFICKLFSDKVIQFRWMAAIVALFTFHLMILENFVVSCGVFLYLSFVLLPFHLDYYLTFSCTFSLNLYIVLLAFWH